MAAGAYSSAKSKPSVREILQSAIVGEPSLGDEVVCVLSKNLLVPRDCKMVTHDDGTGGNPVAHIHILHFGGMGHATNDDRPPA